MGISGDAGIIDPAIFAIMSAKPVVHAKLTAGVKMAGINLQASVEIALMNAFCPAIADLLRHAATSECQPRLVKPNTAPVLTGNPDHYGSSIHHFAKPRIETTRGLGWRLYTRIVDIDPAVQTQLRWVIHRPHV
jgi:hypothetical protein